MELSRLVGSQWARCGIADFQHWDFTSQQHSKVWLIRQIRDARRLADEGRAMNHCVASYHDECEDGTTTIWSMRAKATDRYQRVLTVEVDPKHRAIVTALGHNNRAATPDERKVLKIWAEQESLRVAI